MIASYDANKVSLLISSLGDEIPIKEQLNESTGANSRLENFGGVAHDLEPESAVAEQESEYAGINLYLQGFASELCDIARDNHDQVEETIAVQYSVADFLDAQEASVYIPINAPLGVYGIEWDESIMIGMPEVSLVIDMNPKPVLTNYELIENEISQRISAPVLPFLRQVRTQKYKLNGNFY